MVALANRERRVTSHCPICRFATPLVLDQRERVPLLQNRLWPDRLAARTAPTGKLDFVLCAVCGLAWNRAFIPDLVVYDPNYNNDQMGSLEFRTHADAMRDRILARIPHGTFPDLIEIGCGQGAFLAGLAQTGRFASLEGFDPAWRGEDGVPTGGLTVHRRYLEPDTLGDTARDGLFVVSRHTIEHIADPLGFLRTLRAAMSGAGGALFLETPDIEWIVRTFQPHDLFYEHCSIFSQTALQLALETAGFELVSIERVFGGQYLWAEARPAESGHAIAGSSDFASAAAAFAKAREHFVHDWRERLALLSRDGNVYVWGAASKGVTFATLVDPDGGQLAGAIDINPDRVGKFLPVTALAIVAPSALKDGDSVITMNPNYRAEIARDIGAMGIAARLLAPDGTEYPERAA